MNKAQYTKIANMGCINMYYILRCFLIDLTFSITSVIKFISK